MPGSRNRPTTRIASLDALRGPVRPCQSECVTPRKARNHEIVRSGSGESVLVSAEKNAIQTSDGVTAFYRSQPRHAGLLTTAWSSSAVSR
jgi:hypothetical protein